MSRHETENNAVSRWSWVKRSSSLAGGLAVVVLRCTARSGQMMPPGYSHDGFNLVSRHTFTANTHGESSVQDDGRKMLSLLIFCLLTLDKEFNLRPPVLPGQVVSSNSIPHTLQIVRTYGHSVNLPLTFCKLQKLAKKLEQCGFWIFQCR